MKFKETHSHNAFKSSAIHELINTLFPPSAIKPFRPSKWANEITGTSLCVARKVPQAHAYVEPSNFLTFNWWNIFAYPLSTVTAVSLTLWWWHVGHGSHMGTPQSMKKKRCTADLCKDKGWQCSVCRLLQQHNRR